MAARRRSKPDPARRAAYDALRAVHAEGAYANLVLADVFQQRRISGRDAAFATELLNGSCRLEGSYDKIIAAASGRALSTLQPAVLDLLRLGAHQILSMRVPGHAAVAATVDLAAAAVGERVTGLVNAVLRKIIAQDLAGWIGQLSQGLDDRDALALRTHHPRWIVDAYADVLPAEELEPALAANNEPPVTTLVARPGLGTVQELLEAGADPGHWSTIAARWHGNPGDLAAVRAGRVGVQDEGSQLVAQALAAAPVSSPSGPEPVVSSGTDWWLDLCAGPGGKAALLTGLAAAAGARLLASERQPHRATLVRQALRGYWAATAEPPTGTSVEPPTGTSVEPPTGTSVEPEHPTGTSVELVETSSSSDLRHQPLVLAADATRPAWRAASFSKVLADVPCTGLGALRRRPESRWRRTAADLDTLLPLQRALLSSALDAVRPGGCVAYVTCSPHRAETVDIVQQVLASRSDIQLVPTAPLLPQLAGTGADLGDFLQLWPHRHGTDAMFLALLAKTGAG